MSTAPLRQELEDLIRRDLLGPAGGEQEIITEQSVRNRYLRGMLAPLKLVEIDEEPFQELADSSEDNTEEGTAEPSTPAKRGIAGLHAVFALGSEDLEQGRRIVGGGSVNQRLRRVLWSCECLLAGLRGGWNQGHSRHQRDGRHRSSGCHYRPPLPPPRSEEHTSE